MMTEKVAIVYWCDGAGHAARSIPVARELESRGVEVSMAGGGQGQKFVEMNGFEHPDLTTVAVKGSTPLSFAKHTVFDLIPSSVRRMRELHQWLKDEDPDKLVTDDVFAGLAAAAQGIEFYRIDHLTPDLLDLQWAIPLTIYNEISLAFAEQIIVTSLWADEPDPDGITRVGPLAQEGEATGDIEPYDVLLNPGTHGENFDEIRRRLEADGLEVRTVGDDEWETKPTMTPYTAAADVVICTGFSSIADTVVAGTPCVIYPFLPFQEAIARRAEDKNIQGVARASTVTEVIEKTRQYRDSGERPEHENGAPAFVDIVLSE
jgi:UDP-N-acetylglucosamine:LPS N-acetylglucosamine transferase